MARRVFNRVRMVAGRTNWDPIDLRALGEDAVQELKAMSEVDQLQVSVFADPNDDEDRSEAQRMLAAAVENLDIKGEVYQRKGTNQDERPFIVYGVDPTRIDQEALLGF